MHNAVTDLTSDGVDALERALLQRAPLAGDEAPRCASAAPCNLVWSRALRRFSRHVLRYCRPSTEDVSAFCEQFLLQFRKILDRNFDIFEMYTVRNILKVPESLAARKDDMIDDLPPTSPAATTGAALSADEAAVRQRIDDLVTQLLVVRVGALPSDCIGVCMCVCVCVCVRERERERVCVSMCE